MKTKTLLLTLIFFAALFQLDAQDVTTVEAKNNEISENLDLEAVASVFGDSKNLEDFEKRLNDPETQISNLDLNEDGEVDYLRVLENEKNNMHVITIQAVLEKDKYQDVATINVEKDNKGETQVKVVGDVQMYGPDYTIVPVYVHPPLVITWFWGPYYRPWRSPFHWGYYPPYYRPWRPYPAHQYRSNVHVNINVNNSYHRTNINRNNNVNIKNNSRNNNVNVNNNSRNNNVKVKNKSKTNNTESRNRNNINTKKGTASENRRDIKDNKGIKKTSTTGPGSTKKSTGKKVQKDWKPASNKTGSVKSKGSGHTPSIRSNKPHSKPAAKTTHKATPSRTPQRSKAAKKSTGRSKRR